jgi:hypothetical protein
MDVEGLARVAPTKPRRPGSNRRRLVIGLALNAFGVNLAVSVQASLL